MIKRMFVLFFCGFSLASIADEAAPDKLISTATNSDFAYNRLATFCDKFGSRFSGTTNLEMASDWVLAEMKKDGLENVHGEDVMVPHWVRGNESVELLSPRPQKLAMLGLGGSVATPPEGITAEVLVVKGFADLSNHVSEAKGKIVLFNEPFRTYHETVLIRTRGAMHAAQAGAVASLIRSVTPFSMNTPHTGNMRYTNSLPKIPHAAITVEAADMLQRMQDRGEKIVVRLKMEAKTLPDAKSRNVIGEIVGREKPEEIVIVSGHIDSWDVGQGAMDDGGGCVAAWEAVRLMHKLGLRPRRTIRVVLWTNEENGIAGGKAYRKAHEKELANHLLAIECDDGVFRPTSFAFTGSDTARKQIEKAAKLFQKVTPMTVKSGAGGADISQLEDDGVPLMDLLVDSTKYFWFHHTDADTINVINRDELNQCVAAMAVMSYAIADSSKRLPR